MKVEVYTLPSYVKNKSGVCIMFWFEYSEIPGMLCVIYSRALEIFYVSFTVTRPPEVLSKFEIVSLMSGKTLNRIQPKWFKTFC